MLIVYYYHLVQITACNDCSKSQKATSYWLSSCCPLFRSVRKHIDSNQPLIVVLTVWFFCRRTRHKQLNPSQLLDSCSVCFSRWLIVASTLPPPVVASTSWLLTGIQLWSQIWDQSSVKLQLDGHNFRSKASSNKLQLTNNKFRLRLLIWSSTTFYEAYNLFS